MDEGVKQDIIVILESVIQAFNKYDPEAIMELSNHIIHSASVYQERFTSMVAICIYSIGKIMARGKIRRFPQDSWNDFERNVRFALDCSVKALKKNDFKKFDKCLVEIQKSVIMLDESFMTYVDYVFNQARLTKGAKVYEHGVSLKRVSELFGISEWELMNYAGKTRIIERDVKKSDVKERLEKIRGYFK